jgi:endoglucanase
MNSSSRFLALATLVACSLSAQSAQIDPAAQVGKMGRGVNIIGYDPLWNDFTKARFHERHFQLIHDAGFQTVRVNLQAFSHMDDRNRLDATWLKTLDWVVKNALANDLTVILDEHDYGFCAEHADTCQTKLLAFWQQVSEIYKDAPPSVIFEILNEPNGQLTDARWNALMHEALALIRKTNPTRNIVIGPAFWNGIHHLDQLDLPDVDRHIIVTVHYYLPMSFTHQGASWSKTTAKLSGVTWGTDAEKQHVVDDFAGVQQWAKAHNRPILLGEFGAYDKGPLDSRVLYTSWVARTAESMRWAWTYWQFDSNFIVWDMNKDAWVEPIRKALIP